MDVLESCSDDMVNLPVWLHACEMSEFCKSPVASPFVGVEFCRKVFPACDLLGMVVEAFYTPGPFLHDMTEAEVRSGKGHGACTVPDVCQTG